MIERYSRPEMASIWEEENKFKIWLEVETLALEGLVREGLADQADLDEVRAKGGFDIQRIGEIEAEVKHDVIAFLSSVAEVVGPAARCLHRGMTSSDLLDTAFAVQLKQSGEIILKGLDEVIAAVGKRAEEYKHLPCIGRSHGIHAEPTTIGIKILSWYSELKRNKVRIEQALQQATAGTISGAVGTYASIPPSVEEFVLSKLGLEAETVPSQVVHRDRHAQFFLALAQLGSSIERFVVEVRHLQRTEVREMAEKFTPGQKGSSAMPHKMNPILSENLTGMARLLRSYSQAALENIPLWHERDISHSSVERVIGPDACVLTDFMLYRFKSIVENFVVFEDQVERNLNLSHGAIFSGALLLALVDSGIVRDDAYKIVQTQALAAWEEGVALKDKVLADQNIMSKVSKDKVEQVFDLSYHLKQVDYIFNRAYEA